MGINETRIKYDWQSPVPTIAALFVVLPVLALGLISVLPISGHHHRNYNELKSKRNLRGHAQGLVIFAGDHSGAYPAQDQWPDALLEANDIDVAMLISPIEDGDGISYIYAPGPFTFDETQILIYEDPKHWPKIGVLVGFADNHVEFVPFEEFERMHEEQLQQTEAP